MDGYIKNKVEINNVNNNTINKLDNIFNTIIHKKIDNIHNNIDKIKSNFELIKNNKYNALLIRKNKQINNIDDIKNGIYDIKINGQIRQINIEIL